MQKNVLEYIENSVEKYSDKPCFYDREGYVTFGDVLSGAAKTGSILTECGYYNEPVIIYMDKCKEEIIMQLGVIYSGCYYIPIDSSMGKDRIEHIVTYSGARVAICDDRYTDYLADRGIRCIDYTDALKYRINEEMLEAVREKQIDTDIIYIVFTSGSTGEPKGVVSNHRAVIDYTDNLCEILKVDDNTVFGNQVPLYLDACLKEIYPVLSCGACAYIIPTALFSFPVELIKYINENKINTICWVVSAYVIISSVGALDYEVPNLKVAAFGGEVFPINQFKIWQEKLKNTRFINLYGPTEATGMSCYYEVNRDRELDEIPIGRPFNNTRIILLNNNEDMADEGEICITGSCLSAGYYRDDANTANSFVQNPLNKNVREIIYKTGDLGRYNGNGELVFIGRKDRQIKHRGYRIELGEIELAILNIDNIRNACVIYDNNKISAYYVGDVDKAYVKSILREKLPEYMMPYNVVKVVSIPLTCNGKIDRVRALEMIKDE